MWKLTPLLIVAMTSPAKACHHYHVWHYRFPQKCYVAYVKLPPLKHDKSTPPPADPVPDSIFPPEAIYKLQQELKALHSEIPK